MQLREIAEAGPPELDPAVLGVLAEPGCVEAGIDFVLESEASGTRRITETRVTATDPRARVRFGVYGVLTGGGSGLASRELLRAVARRAEARHRRPPAPTSTPGGSASARPDRSR